MTLLFDVSARGNATLIASTEILDVASADMLRQQEMDRRSRIVSDLAAEDDLVRTLTAAADQYIVSRGDQKTVIAGYPWFTDWGRDTMIALPGLTLVTGRDEIARSILCEFAQHVDRGMLPNRFPDAGEEPEYNSVDAALWFFVAAKKYFDATGEQPFLPVMRDIVTWYSRGTRYNIHLDASDGLLYAGEPAVQLTWMDAKVGDWVVTPRIGKPVEVNALWYNALVTMAHFAQVLDKPADEYESRVEQARRGFQRFWNEAAGWCFDVIDGPEGNDPSLRPHSRP